MLYSITWQSFALILLAVIAAYYTLCVLLFYRGDGVVLLKRWMSGHGKALSNSPVNNGSMRESTAVSMVMGTINEEVNIHSIPETIDSEELIFIEDENAIPESFAPLLEHAAPADSLVIGSVADLLHEIKTLFKMIQEYNSSKEESCSLLQSLLTKYPHLAESKFKDPITEYVCEQSRKSLAFELGYQEVTALWRRLAANET